MDCVKFHVVVNCWGLSHLREMNKALLQDACEFAGLPDTGTKGDMISRLAEPNWIDIEMPLEATVNEFAALVVEAWGYDRDHLYQNSAHILHLFSGGGLIKLQRFLRPYLGSTTPNFFSLLRATNVTKIL